MKFSPWNFTSSENLINQFFAELRTILTPKDNSSALSTIGKLLEEYSDSFNLIELIPGGKAIASFLETSSKATGKVLQSKAAPKSLETVRKELEEALRKQSHRIIVVIDDIDRLTNEQIRTVFQLVKQVAGLPNITYILSMDRDIVVGALETIQKCNGNEYLEKIVQIPFDIPPVDKERLQRMLFTRLDELLKVYPSENFDTNHWQRVYRYCIKPFIQSVRDINRLTNVFRFRYSLLHEEVNFADLLGITALTMYLPELGTWIAQNKQFLCQGMSDYYLLSYNNPKASEKVFSDLFKRLNIEENRGYEYLSSLFPIVSNTTGKCGYTMGDTTDNQLRKFFRIASPERFDLYFQLDISQVSVSHEVVKNATFELQDDELKNLIILLNDQNKAPFFLEEFQEIIPQIPS